MVRRIRAETQGTAGASHHLYIILLDGLGPNRDEFGLYVGETSLEPAARFSNHKSGHKASRVVRNRGVRLLPRLYQHLNPLTREEAKRLESLIAAALIEAGIPNVRGGH